MTDLWQLPREATLGGESYPHRTDYRQILKLMALLSDEGRPAHLRWLTALHYFYEKPIPRPLEEEAMAYLSDFLSCGEPGTPGPKLLDWQADAPEIIADINAAAGREVRSLDYLHWWSFLSFFHGIREGRLSFLVTLRDKLRRGRKLDPHEQEYYSRNKAKVRLRPPESGADAAHRKKLEELLNETVVQRPKAPLKGSCQRS